MIDFKINGNSFIAKANISIIESCKFTGVQIPRFCYQESLSIAGNCRMCLIELENSDKLVIACLTNIESEFNIITNSLAVRKARENVIESLLLNHPLDCPICDQAGECDLQDQTKIYGNYFNKMFSNRRGVEDKKFGSIIKTVMTRCIHCTRCVRFSTEILGSENLGTLNRGNSTEIGIYTSKYTESSISGNIIDLCPVGALTAKSHAYQTRPWELKVIETIDLTDSLGSSIFVNFKETEIVRILPKPNQINGNLISNKTRFSYDALVNNRIYESSDSTDLSWNSLLVKYTTMEKKNLNLLIIINEQSSLKLINKLKFLSYFDNQIKLRSFSRFTEYTNLNYFLNDSIELFNRDVNNCSIIIGPNDRSENEILNARVRIKALNQNYLFFNTNYKYNIKNLNLLINLNINEIISLFEGKFNKLSNLVLEHEGPQIIVGEDLKKRVLNIKYLKSVINNLNRKAFNILINSASNSEGFFFLGIKSVNLKDFFYKNTFFFIDINRNIVFNKIVSMVKGDIYWFESHFSSFVRKDSKIIPVASNYFESAGDYINLEQRSQESQKIFNNINNLNTIEFFLAEIFNEKVFKFNYLSFLRREISFENRFVFSFTKKIFNFQLNNYINTYPIKAHFHKNMYVDNFTRNSYSLIFSSLCARQNLY